MPEILKKSSRQSLQETLLLNSRLPFIWQGLRLDWGLAGNKNLVLRAPENCVLKITRQKRDSCHFNTFVSKTNPTNMRGRFFDDRYDAWGKYISPRKEQTLHRLLILSITSILQVMVPSYLCFPVTTHAKTRQALKVRILCLKEDSLPFWEGRSEDGYSRIL